MISKTGDWAKAKVLLASAPKDLQEAARKALLQEAHFLRGKVSEGIVQQSPGGKNFRPLRPMTIAIRQLLGLKDTKALIERGDLRRSITVTEHGGQVFVGVLKTTTNRDGTKLINIAHVNEFGSNLIIVRITDKMRALLAKAARLAGLPRKEGKGTGILITRIPPRPFLGPVWEKWGKPADLNKRFEERLRKLLAGRYT